MEQVVIQWFNLILNTFNWQLWVFNQWWAWAFIGIPAVATLIASIIWISLLTSPIWMSLNGVRQFLVAVIGGKKK